MRRLCGDVGLELLSGEVVGVSGYGLGGGARECGRSLLTAGAVSSGRD